MITVIQFILALSLLIILHEGGHYFFARLFKTRVEKFYLFFDFLFPFSNILPFSLFKKKIGDTEYGLGWFPLGGYVKIAGMVDESMDTEQLARPPQPWEFRSKPAWQRLLIMLGGIIVNVITAFIIFAFIFWIFGEKKLPISEVNKKGGIQIVDSFAYDLGFQNGDKLISADGVPIKYFAESFEQIMTSKSVVVNRNGAETTINLPDNFIGQFVDRKSGLLYTAPFPAIVGEVVENSPADIAGLISKDEIVGINNQELPNFIELRNALAQHKGDSVQLSIIRDGMPIQLSTRISAEGTLGFKPVGMSYEELGKIGYYNMETYTYSFLAAIPKGISFSWEKVVSYANQFKMIFNPKTEAYKGVGSFVSMAKIFGDEFDWERFWRITGFLSIILAFMNLLPIPGLDGGYVLFTLYEMITGKKPGDRFLEVATTIGLMIILLFMFYAIGNDIFRNFIAK